MTGIKLRKLLIFKRAGNRVRTDDLLITNQLLYQLSYAGFSGGEMIPAVAPASKRNLSCDGRIYLSESPVLIQWMPEICHSVVRSMPAGKNQTSERENN